MLFRRARPLPFHQRLLGLIWPRSGFRRTARYVAHRLARLPGTPHRIAAGFASGAAISFTPLVGFHFLGGALLALVLRGNLLASAIGTAVGNPWTFPFIWAWIYGLGRWILGQAGHMEGLPRGFSITHIFDNFWGIFLPMMVGGLPTALVAWFVFYIPVRRLVAGYQAARRRRLARRGRQRHAGKPRHRSAAGNALEGET
ncbi:hypothetical protein SAMN06265365_10371 [Tistlia consotensis]|uniref:DUF2062 domain-containing protein n=1 Tax=Tistlia consotensis USBA 355 TaxID=560819 RepID=A0A1Y6BM67_9PROT|nr:DUF2062 domain-containing protein [Tistlia consotensis]SMF18251.1 hypothetical protein SAMN05428998_106154 [Tistlia consotensis USBA 355]SNR39794.1 hypothetical protein SAMN06265365_10371 [Tistlia consotensis]